MDSDDVTTLIDVVETAEEGSPELDQKVADILLSRVPSPTPRFTSDIGEAIKLIPQHIGFMILQPTHWTKLENDRRASVTVYEPNLNHHMARGNTVPLAICAAILRLYLSKQRIPND